MASSPPAEATVATEHKETLITDPDLTNFTTFAPGPPSESLIPGPNSHSQNGKSYHASTLAIHADDNLRRVQDIAPPIHMASTFHYPKDPTALLSVRELKAAHNDDNNNNNGSTETTGSEQDQPAHVYSRESTHNTDRLETVLWSLLHADSIVYSSGLAALHAAYVLLKPQRVAISGGYHGAHAVLELHKRLTGLEVFTLEQATAGTAGDAEGQRAAAVLGKGDIFHVETPVNPTGEARDLSFFAAQAHAVGAYLLVDATFGPPPLQDPFVHGADIVMHSGTKYFGGHSDLLCGVLATPRADWAKTLRADRSVLGSVMGGLEAWLVIRSLRTLDLRVERASKNVSLLVNWLETERCRQNSTVSNLVESVLHASLQSEASQQNSWLRKQMPHGYGPVFAIIMKDTALARQLPSFLSLFQHATSLGGVESLIEWRAMSDDTVDERLLRVSVGVEYWEDLKGDLLRGFERAEKAQKEMGKGSSKLAN